MTLTADTPQPPTDSGDHPADPTPAAAPLATPKNVASWAVPHPAEAPASASGAHGSDVDLGVLSRQLKALVTLLSILVFIAASFFGYSVYRQQAIKSCVASKADSSGSVGVGEMVGCMTDH